MAILQFSMDDLSDIRGLERVFRQVGAALTTQAAVIATLPSTDRLVSQLLPIIRQQLQATGSTPLNLQSLPGTGSATTPTITDFTNAQHDHTSVVQGGTLPASAIATGVLPIARGGTGAGTAAGARSSLGAAAIQSPGGPVTIPLAALSGGGTQGSITINAEGVVTAYVLPT